MFQSANPFTHRSIRDRAYEDQEMKREILRQQVAAGVLKQQQEQDAVMAAPFIAALDATREDYPQQKAEVLKSIPGSALLDRGLQSMMQSNDYSARFNAKPDTHVDALLTQHPELQDDYEAEVATLGKPTAVKNLRWNANDRTLTKQLGQMGYDFTDQSTLESLRLPGKKHLDPVRVESWIKKNGTKGLDALSISEKMRLQSEWMKALAKAEDPLTPEDQVPIYRDAAATYQAQLGGGRTAGVARANGNPSPFGTDRGVAAPASSAPATISPTLPAVDQWQTAKEQLANAFLTAAGSPQQMGILMQDPTARKKVMESFTGKKAFSQERNGSKTVTYDEVFENLLKDDAMLQRLGLIPFDVRGHGVRPGQPVSTPAGEWKIHRKP